MGLSFKERLAMMAAKDPSLQPKIEAPTNVSQEVVEAKKEEPTPTTGSRFSRFKVQESPVSLDEEVEGGHGQNKPVAVLLGSGTGQGVDLAKVIAAHNTIANKSMPEAEAKEVDPLSGVEANSVVKELQQRIHNLANLEDGIDLKGEVGLLKTMITQNGDACRYLLDEDLGLFVRALRRMTDNKVAQDMSRAKPSKAASSKEPSLSMQDVAALMASGDLDFSL